MSIRLVDPVAGLNVDLNLADNSGPWLARGGWIQIGTVERLDGRDPWHKQKAKIVADGRDDGDRGDLYADVSAINLAAMRTDQPSHPLHKFLGSRPYIRVQGPTEGAYRYALISMAHVPKLDQLHMSGSEIAELELEIVKEPHWRTAVPGTRSDLITAQVIDSHDHGAASNSIALAAASMSAADTLSPVRFRITADVDATREDLGQEVIMAWAPEPENGGTPQLFYAWSDTGGGHWTSSPGYVFGGTYTTETSNQGPLPGSNYGRFVSNQDEDPAGLTFQIPDIEDNYGRWGVHVLARCSADDVWRINLAKGFRTDGSQLRVETGGVLIKGDPGNNDADGDWRAYYVGELTLPERKPIAGRDMVGGTTARDVDLIAWHMGTDSDTLEVGGFFLVPLHGWIHRVSADDRVRGDDHLVMDSDSRQTWTESGLPWTEVSTNNNVLLTDPNVIGPYPRIDPTQDGRIYIFVFHNGTNSDPYYFPFDADYQVELEWVPMRKYLS